MGQMLYLRRYRLMRRAWQLCHRQVRSKFGLVSEFVTYDCEYLFSAGS